MNGTECCKLQCSLLCCFFGTHVARQRRGTGTRVRCRLPIYWITAAPRVYWTLITLCRTWSNCATFWGALKKEGETTSAEVDFAMVCLVRCGFCCFVLFNGAVCHIVAFASLQFTTSLVQTRFSPPSSSSILLACVLIADLGSD